MTDQPKGKARLEQEELAKHLGLTNFEGLKGSELYARLKSKIGKDKSVQDAIAEMHKAKGTESTLAPKSEIIAKGGENVQIIPPSNRVDVQAPVIHMNVPAPVVNIGAKEAPTWWEGLGAVKDAVLYAVFGAAVWAVFGQQMLTVVAMR